MPFISAIVLAAGKGTRMKSKLPKVLHQAGGKHLIRHVLDAVTTVGAEQTVVVVGHGAGMVREILGDRVDYALQEPQLGTGHAVMMAAPLLKSNQGVVMVVCGDTPLLTAATLQRLLEHHIEQKSVCTVLTAVLPDATGYGRVVRRQDQTVDRIVEQKDASPEELIVREINTGTYCFDLAALREALATLTTNNVQGEYYLTDTVAYFTRRGMKVNAYILEDFSETLGINDRQQLAEAEKILRYRKVHGLMEAGVTIVDPVTTFIDTDVQVGQDTIIEPFTFIRGKTIIGTDCVIGPHSDISDSKIETGSLISRSVVLQSTIGENCSVGPFAYLRPGTVLKQHVKIGDFVEVKKSVIGQGSKIPHLSYVGDAEVGQNVNIGAGTITCNYDGVHKYATKIKDGAFIGSNTNLVAPVEVGSGAMIGAGSTITKDVPDHDLSVARGKQVNFPGGARKRKG